MFFNVVFKKKQKKQKHVGVCVRMWVCEWLNLLGKGNDWMSRGPDDCDGEVKPMYSVYTKRMQQQTNVFFCASECRQGVTYQTLTSCPIF